MRSKPLRPLSIRVALMLIAFAAIPAAGCELLAPLDALPSEPADDAAGQSDAGPKRDAADADVSPDSGALQDSSVIQDAPPLGDAMEGGATDVSITSESDASAPSRPDDADASPGADADVSILSPSDGGDADASETAPQAPDARDAAPVESGAATITVKGTVIGYWRHHVPDVDVHLGDRTTKTDANGHFTFTDVTPPYDIGLVLREEWDAAWLYKGLTRADPTLQASDALSFKETTTTYRYLNLPPQPFNDGAFVNRTLATAFGSPDTNFERLTDDLRFDVDSNVQSWWEGPSATSGTVHALIWEKPSDRWVSPSRYVSYDAKPLALQEGARASVDLDMSPDTIVADLVTGGIDSFASDRQVDGYLRFDTGAIMHIVSTQQSAASFSMLMPKLPNATVSVSAMSGTTFTGPYGLAHRDGIQPGEPGVQLTIPQPVSLAVPLGGVTDVTTSTTFQWSSSPRVALLAIGCKGATTGERGPLFRVVTEDYRAQLPSLTGAAGLALPKNRECHWVVEIHGAYPTVNEATGPEGMLDPYSLYPDGVFQGPKRDNGTFTMSATRGFTTAP